MAHGGCDASVSCVFRCFVVQRRRMATLPPAFGSIALFAQCSTLLAGQQMRDLARTCYYALKVCDASVQTLIRGADDQPMLNTQAADGTPVQVADTRRIEFPDGRVIRRFDKTKNARLNSFVCLMLYGMRERAVEFRRVS